MGKAPLPHNKRNCNPPYSDHYLNNRNFIQWFKKFMPSLQSQSSCQCYKLADEINTVARVNKAGITG